MNRGDKPNLRSGNVAPAVNNSTLRNLKCFESLECFETSHVRAVSALARFNPGRFPPETCFRARSLHITIRYVHRRASQAELIVSHRLPLSKTPEAYAKFDRRGTGEGPTTALRPSLVSWPSRLWHSKPVH